MDGIGNGSPKTCIEFLKPYGSKITAFGRNSRSRRDQKCTNKWILQTLAWNTLIVVMQLCGQAEHIRVRNVMSPLLHEQILNHTKNSLREKDRKKDIDVSYRIYVFGRKDQPAWKNSFSSLVPTYSSLSQCSSWCTTPGFVLSDLLLFIFPHHGSSSHPLHWKVDSSPLDHQWSPSGTSLHLYPRTPHIPTSQGKTSSPNHRIWYKHWPPGVTLTQSSYTPCSPLSLGFTAHSGLQRGYQVGKAPPCSVDVGFKNFYFQSSDFLTLTLFLPISLLLKPSPQ